MARSFDMNQTDVYRALVQTRDSVDRDWEDHIAFGPYDRPSAARDWYANWNKGDYEEGLRRKKIQILTVDWDAKLVWVDA